ncbi:MAG: YihY/virulence factor BrkB family protein [Rhodopila sp.]
MSLSTRLQELKKAVAAQAPLTNAQGRTSEARDNRGRSADTPAQIPLPGWKDIAVRSYQEVNNNNIFLIAGGVTYTLLLALFPALAALVAIYGLLFDPAQVEQQLHSLASILPQQSMDLVATQLHSLVQASGKSLGFGAVVTLLFALWSASRGMSGLIIGCDIAYRQPETRSFLKFNAIAIGLTIAGLISGTLVIALVGVLPAAIQFIGLGSILTWLILILQWPILIAIAMFSLALLYRYTPDRNPPQWRWVTPGAIAATALWLIGSIGFSVYVSNFNSYNATYGSLGGVVILLTWLYLSSFVALLGAVINAQAERQTQHDSTDNPDESLGRRGAYAADTVGDAKG